MQRRNERKADKDRRSTIKDVAAQADVSISTVSLVMNERGGVSPDTRERVLEIARRLDYVPTQAARQLVTRRTGNIGFVLREDHFTRSEPFYTRIFLGTEFEARNRNVYVLLATIPASYRPGVDAPRFVRELNVDGVLVAGKVDDAFLAELQAVGLPVVLVDYEVGSTPAVVVDNQQGARTAVEHLIARGHRDIAAVAADAGHPSIKARLGGYQLALAGAGLTLSPERMLVSTDGKPDRATGVRFAKRLLALDPRPSAVFCANDALALGVMDFAAGVGVAIPGELAVVGFDDVPGASDAQPALTTVRVYKEQIGELALRYLSDVLEDRSASNRAAYERGCHVVSVGTELIVRESS